MSDFSKLEHEYWSFIKYIDLFTAVTPTNLSSEKEIYFQHLTANEAYNPVFEYAKTKKSTQEIIAQLIAIKKEFKSTDNPIWHYYEKLINYNMKWTVCFDRRYSNEFSDLLGGLFGYPSKVNYNYVIKEIKNLVKYENVERKIVPLEFVNIIQSNKLFKSSEGWEINIEDASARIAINPVQKTISIGKNSKFSKNEIPRLIIHEIETHLLRYENGKMQAYEIFKNGFPDYLETEEGLAIWAEKYNGYLSEYDYKKYCCRYVAVYHAKDKSFFEVYKIVNKYLDDQDTFDVVARVKRGMLDTKGRGVFTKDRIYIDGYLKIRRLSMEKIKKLYVGKVSIEAIDDQLVLKSIKNAHILPAWMK